MEDAAENKLQCPLCHGPVEETGKPTWAYCPTHGWVKYKSVDEKETEDLLSKINLRASVLAKQAEEKLDGIRKKSPLLSYIVPALFITVLLGFLVGYFFWRDAAHKGLETRRTELPSQKKEQVREIQHQVSLPSNELVALNQEKEDLREKETEKKSLQPQKAQQTKQPVKASKSPQVEQSTKPSKPVFTVQAGLFQNESNAKNLNKMLHEKGYEASVITSKSKKGETLYRVCIGKFSDRKKAEDIAKKLGKEAGVQGFVKVK